MLDLESFTYLARALESPLSPLVILASNRGLVSPRTSVDNAFSNHDGGDLPPSPHGLPSDLLSRCLIIPTFPYAKPEIRSIVATRAKVEGVQLADPALDELAGVGAEISLRYAVGLIGPAAVLGRIAGKTVLGSGQMGEKEKSVVEVGVEEIREAKDLFWDAGRSAKAVGTGSGWIA